MPFVPQNIGRTIHRFGVTVNNPATIITSDSSLNLFYQPEHPTFTNKDFIQPQAGDGYSGTADQFGAFGYRAMPKLLLDMPSPGNLKSFAPTYLMSGGSIVIPASAVNATVTLVLNQNYFQAVNQTIEIFPNPIGMMITPQSLTSGTYFWNLLFALSSGPIGVVGSGFVTLNNVITATVCSTQSFSQFRPTVALSMGFQFGGDITPPDVFSASLYQHEIQQIGSLDLVNRASG